MGDSLQHDLQLLEQGSGIGGTDSGDLPSVETFRDTGVISTFAELQSLIPDYASQSFSELLRSPVFSGPNAFSLSQDFQRDLVDTLLQIESGTGIPIGSFVTASGGAGALGGKTSLNNLLSAGGSGGSGGGGGGAGDPFAAGKFALQKYDALLAARQITASEAIARWQADFDEIIANSNIDITNVGNQLNADTTNATLAGQRAADIATGKARLNTEATNRADLTQQILRSSLPQGVSLNLPGAGQVPTHNINVPELLSQGLPSLPDQDAALSDLFPIANVQPGTVAPIDAPAFPTLPPVPGLSAVGL